MTVRVKTTLDGMLTESAERKDVSVPLPDDTESGSHATLPSTKISRIDEPGAQVLLYFEAANMKADVFVNGEQVIRDGEHTGATPGRVVRGPGWKGE